MEFPPEAVEGVLNISKEIGSFLRGTKGNGEKTKIRAEGQDQLGLC